MYLVTHFQVFHSVEAGTFYHFRSLFADLISIVYIIRRCYPIIFSELNPDQVKELDLNSVRNITMQDFRDSLKRIRRSVSPASLAAYEKWSFEYGDVSI